MDVHEAALALGVTPSTIRAQIERGNLTATKVGRAWDMTVEAVEAYRRDYRGHMSRTFSSEARARQVASVKRPETRAKMRAAKLGRRQSPEHVANRAAAARGKPLSPAHRRAMSEAQKGKPLAASHLKALRAYHRTRRGKPLSLATRQRIAEALATAYREGRRSYSTLEERAAELLEPLGFERSVVLGHHVFDFGTDAILVEVNGCAWHDHRAVKPSCPVITRRDSNAKDDERRALARLHDRILVELWQCEEADWPTALALI